MNGLIAYLLSKGYTDQSISGISGTLAGKNCTVESITEITGGHRLTFKWTDDDGNTRTDTMDVMDGIDGTDGTDGLGIKSVAINAENNHLIVTFDDDTTADAGEVPTEKGDTGRGIESMAIDSSNHLIVTYDDDTTDDAGEVPNVQADFEENDTTADAYIKNKPTLGTASAKDYTDTVRPNSHDLVESNAVANAINQALTSVYTPRGDLSCAELTSALLIAENVGNVYEMSDSGTTSALFVQGAGIPISAGNNVGIIKASADTYMFNYMGNSFDLHDYQKKDLASSIEGASTVEGALGALSTNKATQAEVNDIVNVYGAKNLLPYPWTESNITKYGLTFVDHGDGSVTITGGNTSGNAVFYNLLATMSASDYTFKAGTYTISNDAVLPEGVLIRFGKADGIYTDCKNAKEATFTLSSDFNAYCLIRIDSTLTENVNITLKPMVRLSAIKDDTYVPYVPTNAKLNEEKMSYADNGVLGAKNLLPTPYYSTKGGTTTSGTLTVTENADGSVTIDGTASGQSYIDLARNDKFLKAGTYILSGGITSKQYVYINCLNNGTYIKTLASAMTSEDKFVLDYNGYDAITVGISIASGESLSNVTFYPMIRLASDHDSTYQPYAMTNRKLTESKANIIYGTNSWSANTPVTITLPRLGGLLVGGRNNKGFAIYVCENGNELVVLSGGDFVTVSISDLTISLTFSSVYGSSFNWKYINSETGSY